MKRWCVRSFSVLLSSLGIVLASCAPATSSVNPVTTAPQVPTATKTTATVAALTTRPPVEAPKYGGVYTGWLATDPMGFDEAYTVNPNVTTARLTHDELITQDWAKGLAGTGETDWVNGFIGRIELETGSLAEKWEFPDDETIVYHIRKGVRWALNPSSEASRLVNGREFTADDVVFSINRNFFTKTAYLYGAYVPGGYAPTSVRALDKYTVEVKVPKTMHGLMLLVIGDFMYMWPKEVINKYGDMKDWRNSVGTGPFMLTDFVSNSSLTYVRNPKYWMPDPAGPGKGNLLPYLDGVKQLIISDISTRLAALRTGKIDMLPGIAWEDGESLIKSNPQLMSRQGYVAPSFPVGRLDKPELPFKDIRVRQAMNMAVNKKALIDSYYGGHAALLGYPWPPTRTYEKIYTPLEQQSKGVQELFVFSTEKAKQLLKEAGYPNGFKTKIVCDGSSTQPDLLSIIREDLLKVGIDMEIQPRETGVYTSIYRGRTHEEMLMKGSVDYAFPFRMLMVRQESFDNPAYFEAPYTRKAYEDISRIVGIDDAAVNGILKDVGKFSLEQAWGIWLPAPQQYRIWWPWVGNYHGEATLGYDNQLGYIPYLCIDNTLKRSMGY
jgi:peptide/nickel transport system substrate-binding protein